MRLAVCDVRFFERRCRTRIPFRFGGTTLVEAPLVLCRAAITVEGRGEHEGFSSDLLVPKWFDKDPGKSRADEIADLLQAASFAAARFVAASSNPASAFDLWLEVERARAASVAGEPARGLGSGFGVALVERAMLDALCRAAGVSIFTACREDLLGFRPRAVRQDLEASPPFGAPKRRLLLRHTVGLGDPLRRGEPGPHPAPEDGLPHALEDDIARYGLRAFKIKLSGVLDADLARVQAIARILHEAAPTTMAVTFDGNEQFQSIQDVVQLLEALRNTPEGFLLDRLLYVEQPLPRHASFSAEAARGLTALRAFAPCIIDEADGSLAAFPEALAAGYRGVSVKSCKGFFRALLHRCLAAGHGGAASDGAFLAAEDLTCLPIFALQQDLALDALLGLEPTERNGHHYFRGLAHLPETEARRALAAHPDLYEERDGMIQLRIRDGALDVGSLETAGFGTALVPSLDAWAML